MPSAPAAASAGYHPRPAQNQLKEIVEENIEELLLVWDERFPLGMRRGSSCGIAGATGRASSPGPGSLPRAVLLLRRTHARRRRHLLPRTTSLKGSSNRVASGTHRGCVRGRSAGRLHRSRGLRAPRRGAATSPKKTGPRESILLTPNSTPILQSKMDEMGDGGPRTRAEAMHLPGSLPHPGQRLLGPGRPCASSGRFRLRS